MAKHPDKMTTLLTTTAAVTPVKLHNESWYDDIELEEANENCAALCNSATDAMEDVFTSSSGVSHKSPAKQRVPTIEKTAAETARNRSLDISLASIHVVTPIKLSLSPSVRDRSADDRREIAVEFLDVSNEQKYDRLVADDKIKNPFKRRLSANSNESRPSSPLSAHCAADEQQQQLSSKLPAPLPAAKNAIDMPKSPSSRSGMNESTTSAENETTTGKKNSTTSASKKSRYEHSQSMSSLSSETSTSTTGGLPAQRGNTDGTTKPVYGKRRHQNRAPIERETCEETLVRRQKQIDYGKNTVGYDMYVQQVPKAERTNDHPWTPPKTNKYSRRAWDGLVKVWRKKLHCWDPESMKAAAASSAAAVDDEDDDDDDDDDEDDIVGNEDVELDAVVKDKINGSD